MPDLPKNQSPRIVVIGSLVFDFVARAPRLPARGETLLGDMFGVFPGGKGANQAVQAGRLGAQVHMVGRVGADFLGERLRASLLESGVHVDFVKTDARMQTAACCIHVDAQGGNSIIIVPQANTRCGKEDIDAARDVIRAADIVLLQLEIPIETVAYAVATATEYHVPVVLNPAPALALPESVLAGVSILTPNEHEACALAGLESIEAAADRLLKLGPKEVVVTLGEHGALLATGTQRTRIEGFAVPVVDTTAAGDGFSGALAVALAEGKSTAQAISFANAAGALACTKVGAQPSLAHRRQVESLLATRENRL